MTNRIECNRVVEICERDNQSEEANDVDHVLAVDQVIIDETSDRSAPAFATTKNVREQNWEQQHRRRKDDGHDSGLVDLERNVGGLTTSHVATNDPFCKLHGNTTLSEFDTHNSGQDSERHNDEKCKHDELLALQDRVVAVGQTGNNRSKDDDGHAV